LAQAYGLGVLRDPRNMVRAGLPEAQSPVDASRHPPERRLNRCRALRWRCGFAGATSGYRAMPSEGIQGDEWAAYVPLDTYDQDERGIAYGTRVLWRRRSGSSRRSHDLPRRAGKQATGRADQAAGHHHPGGRRNAERRPGARCPRVAVGVRPLPREDRWRARCSESGHGGFGPGAAGKGSGANQAPRQRPTGTSPDHCLCGGEDHCACSSGGLFVEARSVGDAGRVCSKRRGSRVRSARSAAAATFRVSAALTYKLGSLDSGGCPAT
jgi:hypothetical protein